MQPDKEPARVFCLQVCQFTFHHGKQIIIGIVPDCKHHIIAIAVCPVFTGRWTCRTFLQRDCVNWHTFKLAARDFFAKLYIGAFLNHSFGFSHAIGHRLDAIAIDRNIVVDCDLCFAHMHVVTYRLRCS